MGGVGVRGGRLMGGKVRGEGGGAGRGREWERCRIPGEHERKGGR